MKLSFVIYLQALGIYLLLTLPTLTEPVIYMYSAMYATTAGLVAWVVFLLVLLLVNKSKPSAPIAKAILFTTIVFAVAAAYKVVLVVAIPGRGFWQLDTDIVFPILAVISGWLSLAANFWKFKARFSKPLLDGFETIFTYDKA